MKKASLLAIAIVSMCTACKKETLVVLEQPISNHQNVGAEIQKIQDIIQHTPTLGSFQEINRTTSIETKNKNCQPIPTAVGQGIVVIELLVKTAKIDYYSAYKFYVEGLLRSGKMQLRVSWMHGRKRRAVTYLFMITATKNYDELGLAIIPNIEVPKDKIVTFTVTGKNNCGQRSEYEATFIYSSGSSQKCRIDETVDLFNKATVVSKFIGNPILSENINQKDK